MRRIAALAALIFGLTALVAVPAVITAAPASALECFGGQVPDPAQTYCVTPPAPTTPPNCGPATKWDGTFCAPITVIPVAPVAPVCNAPAVYEASSNSCKTPPTTMMGPSVPVCNAPAVYEASSNSCKTSSASSTNSGGSSSGSGSGSGLQCSNGWVANPSQTACIAPVVDNSGSQPGASSCGPNTAWNGTYCAPTVGAAAEAAKAGGVGCPALTMWNGKECAATMGGTMGGSTQGSTGNTSGSSGSQPNWQQGVDPCLLSPDRAKCEAAKLASISLCPSGSFFDQGIQGCKSATKQSATIACADGTFKVTALECSTFGGAVGSAIAASTGSTCANGYAPNSTGFCVPIASLAGNNSATSCGPATFWNGTSCAPTTGAAAGSSSPGITPPTGTPAELKQKCADYGFTWTGTSCLAGTAAGTSLGGSCLDGYAASSGGICIPKGYDNGANMPASKNTGPISTSIDPCRVTPVPPSCIASGAVKVSESTVVQAQTARYGPPAPPAGEQSSAGSGGTASSQFAAPPAKKGKAAAPVLIFNVLGSDNKALTDSNGKELTTRPAVKSGNTVFVDKSGSPVITAPTLDPSGRPVTGPDGAVLYTRLMTFAGQEAVTDSSGRAVTATPLLNGAGKALQASNGRVVYAPPVLDAKGNILLNSYGSPILAQPLSDATGGIAVGSNGEPVVVQPMVAEGGKAILKNGQLIYVGGAGSQALTAKNESIQTAFGQTITFCNSGALADEGGNAVLGPDGRVVILSASGVPISANGAVLLDQKGKPIRVTANGGVTDSSGRPILGADSKQIKLGASEVATVLKSGKYVIKSSDGKTITVGLNGQLVDTAGNPVLAAGNKPIFIDPKTKTFKDPSGKAITVSKTGVIAAKSTPLAYQTGALDAA